MKKILTILFFLPFILSAQNLYVKSFVLLKGDLDARVNNPKLDQNGDKCAIIKVVTSQKGFQWEGDALGIIDAPYKVGEYWLYVPHGVRTLTIKHEQLGVLRNYRYPLSIKEADVYELVLTSNKIVVTIEEAVEATQWLVITSEPKNVSVYLNGDYKGETVFQQEMPLGKYEYRLEHPLYRTKSGTIVLDELDGKKELREKLQADFGKLTLKSFPEGGAEVFLDGINTGKITPCVLEKVQNGKHSIFIKHKWYDPIEKSFEVNKSKDQSLDLHMKSNHGEVELVTDDATGVYIDNEFVGLGAWKGKLLSGYHVFRLEKLKYSDATLKVNILRGDNKKIKLSLKPRLGKLKIKTKPYNAKIVIDGKQYGTTPKTIDNLLIGSYKLALSVDGRSTLRKSIIIKEGETLLVDEELQDGKEVLISNGSKKSKIYIDDIFVGTTPVKTIISFGSHILKVEKDGEIESMSIEINDTSSSKISIYTKADIIIEKANRLYSHKEYYESENYYKSYLNNFPSGYRSKIAKRRIRRIKDFENEESTWYVNYHYDKVSQYSVGGGFLYTKGWSGYGTFKMGLGDMPSSYYELNMFISGGGTYMLLYPLWFNVGLGTGFREINNYEVDSSYDYSRFFIYPEIGLTWVIKNKVILKYGIQYNNKDGGLLSQFGIGFTIDSFY